MMQAARPDISIIVVSHNTRTLTLKCIESLRQFANCEVVVVDTGSMDDTMASIAHCDTILVSAPSSTGYAAAAHLGFAKSSGETLIVCNADTEFHPGSVPRLMAALAEDDIGIAAPRLLNPDGSLQQSWARFPNLMSEWTGQLDRSEIDSSETGTHVVSWVGGACIALKRDTWNALNGYNPEIMFYGEDTDLCWRASKAGLKTVLVSDATVLHHGGQSSVSRTPLWLRRQLLQARLRELGAVHGPLVAIPAQCIALARYAVWLLKGFGTPGAHRH